MSTPSAEKIFHKSACILCSINCGLEIQTGGKNGRELLKIRGDREHPSSEGYVCNKAARLNYYQMGADRLDSPMRRTANGSYEPVDWDTAIREVAAGLKGIKEKYGGEKIYFIGGGGQGNHLGGVYSNALMQTLGVKYVTNALAQEKTGEFWVQGKMFGGGGPHGDFHHAEVAVFIGKNPWEAHGFPQTRKVLNTISKDPARTMIVLDPALTRTAQMADFHLRVKPGTDAWCLSAMIAVIVQEGLEDTVFINNHTTGFGEIRAHFATLSIGDYARICDVDVNLIRASARRIAAANSVSVFEDLGIQQNVHSTLVSYLQRILWVITGNFAIKGGHNIAIALLSVTEGSKNATAGTESNKKRTSPVLGSRIITGLLPCNEVPDEILGDHPDRFRAAIIQSANPAHSYANSPRMREAIAALEFSVVIDVAMTETAKLADYVLPACSQFEKHECTFFSVEFPKNYFHLRHPIVDPLPGTLTEAEINTRLVEALGGYSSDDVKQLKAALQTGRQAFAMEFIAMVSRTPKLFGVAPSLLYRTLGTTLDDGKSAAAAPFWALCHDFAQKKTSYAEAAGFTGSAWEIGEAMFAKLLSSKSGFAYTDSGDYTDSWNRVGYPDKRIRLHLEELFPRVANLDETPLHRSAEFPFVLAAGNRRGSTANTIIRDPSWDKDHSAGSLYINPEDARLLNLADGERVKLSTRTGSASTHIEISTIQRQGTVSIPNGFGIDYPGEEGRNVRTGVAPNELTSSADRDFFAGTPWHKYVPARVEKM
ncbi:MAG: molybdopterin-dependent oxidoreductase [Pseudomonadales bacterium]